MSLAIRFGFLFFLVVFVQTKCFAESVADELLPYKKSPKFRTSGISFAPIYKGPTPGDDTVQLGAALPSASTIIFGDVGDDLKIVVDGRSGDQTVNMLILYLHQLDNVSLTYDSATITYEYRSSTEPRIDHGFRIDVPAGALVRTEDSLILQFDADALRRSNFKYWSIAMPGYTTGQAVSPAVATEAFASFEVLSRGKIIDSNWLSLYTEGRSASIQGIEFDMRNRYYYGDSTNVTKYYLSRESTFDRAGYASGWSSFSAGWRYTVPNTYPVNIFNFTLTGLDTSELSADELTVDHSYQEGGQFHYDWAYSVRVKDVKITKTDNDFAILIDSLQLSTAAIEFWDHIAPVHRWGSSFGFRVGNGASLFIRAKRPSAQVLDVKPRSALIYPNPCSDHLIVASEHFKWWVVSALGERIDLDLPKGALLDVSGLAKGVYLLMNGRDAPQRFVKAQ